VKGAILVLLITALFSCAFLTSTDPSSFPPSLRVQLVAAPVQSGIQLGSLNFKAPDGQYVWFSVEVRASEAPQIGAINVEAEVCLC